MAHADDVNAVCWDAIARIKELEDWKASATKQLMKANKLHDVLRKKYVGMDVYDAAVLHIRTLESKLEAIEGLAKI